MPAALHRLLFLGLLAALGVAPAPAANDPAPARPRKIFGHFMGCFLPGRGAMQWHATSGLETMDPPRAVITGTTPLTRHVGAWAVTSIGGTYRNFPLTPPAGLLTNEEAVDLEIRRAMRIGMDGFTFDAWAGGDGAMDMLDLMFKVCEQKKYPFELTITLDTSCIDWRSPKLAPYEGNMWVKCVKWLLDRHGGSPNLARRDGKPLIFGYQSIWPASPTIEAAAARNSGQSAGPAFNAEVARLRGCEEGWQLIVDAYREMDAAIGQPIYWEFCLGAFFHGIEPQPPPGTIVLAATFLAKKFPALGMFLWEGPVPDIGAAVVREGAEWSHPMKLQYENYGYFQAASPGLEWVRGDWNFARTFPSTLLQQITWNDYHETTNLSPGINSRYAYYDIMGQFIRWWKTGEPPTADHDRVYLFSHKYADRTRMFPFVAKARADNLIEVVTILPSPARLRLPGRIATDGSTEWDAPAGMSYKQFPLTPGPVAVELLRGGSVVLRLDSPEPVSDRPFRQDTGKVGISTECRRLWAEDFGSGVPFYNYSEYGDADGDGLPNWFEMLWWGRWGDMSTAKGARPDDDRYDTGKTNLQHYLDQTDPTASSKKVVSKILFRLATDADQR